MTETTQNKTVNVAAPTGGAIAEPIYESAPSEPDDDFWLEQGRKMLTESLAAVRAAASSLMTALGTLQGIYLGILGFAKFIPEDIALWKKAIFVMPLLPWMFALYFCLQVTMTNVLEINLNSPTDIRDQSTKLLQEKQRSLEYAFLWMFIGLVLAMALVVFRLKM